MDNPATARTERHLQMLQELGELGMKLARAVTEQAVETAAEPDRDLGLVFSRIARAVRQTIALEAKLAEDGRAETAARVGGETRTRAHRHKRQVKRLVERAIEADTDPSDHENLFFDLVERPWRHRQPQPLARRRLGGGGGAGGNAKRRARPAAAPGFPSRCRRRMANRPGRLD